MHSVADTNGHVPRLSTRLCNEDDVDRTRSTDACAGLAFSEQVPLLTAKPHDICHSSDPEG